LKDNFLEYMRLIQEERFYEAHEVLEELWFPRRKERCDEVLVIKGFINASVAFELKRLKRDENALRVWKNYEKYRPLIKKCDREIFYKIEKFLDGYYAKYLS